ncbi:MAG: regulatory protein RecX [Candidatus Hatepunaea meridiana]|nr:regulatory protein RecX [Candidatus Hatepunaea meridiana]
MCDKDSNIEKYRLIALKMLARRSLTIKELIDRLKRKGAENDLAKVVALNCVKEGYIKEGEIVEDHINRGREEKLIGRFLLEYELSQRGIRKDVIEEAINRIYPENDEIEIARRFAEKKLRGMQHIPDEKRNRRLGSALHRRGFRGETVAAVMYEEIHSR